MEDTMGTYHSTVAKRRTLGPRKYPGYTETAEILEFAITYPELPMTQVATQWQGS